MVDLLGYLAGALTTCSLLPQVIHTLKTRSTEDISLSMWTLFCAGIILWLVYGITVRSGPLILTNVVSLVLAGSVLVLKIRHG